jgi:hypothetical protein
VFNGFYLCVKNPITLPIIIQDMMATLIEDNNITCGSCGLIFERSKEYKFCSNCFACTGCEIYYCPDCEEEIIVTPVRKIAKVSHSVVIQDDAGCKVHGVKFLKYPLNK